MKKVVIVGASSGIGLELALIYIAKGWTVGVVARRQNELNALKHISPDRVFTKKIDITQDESVTLLEELVCDMGGMDIYIHCSGVMYLNSELNKDLEESTVKVNCKGFTIMIDWVMSYFESISSGHIVAISSIAGTRGLAPAPAYSASKSYQQVYLQALAQKVNIENKNIVITDIRPGFVETPLLKNQKYPMMMNVSEVAFEILKSIEKKRRICTIDYRYKLLVLLWRALPSFIYEKIPLKVK